MIPQAMPITAPHITNVMGARRGLVSPNIQPAPMLPTQPIIAPARTAPANIINPVNVDLPRPEPIPAIDKLKNFPHLTVQPKTQKVAGGLETKRKELGKCSIRDQSNMPDSINEPLSGIGVYSHRRFIISEQPFLISLSFSSRC